MKSEIQSLTTDFDNKKFCLIIIGETSSGKTTFINALTSFMIS